MGDRLEKAVTDTGPIIHLNQINSLKLLGIFEELIIPETVLKELSKVEIPPELKELEYTEKKADRDKQLGLDPGEQSALEIALKEDKMFLTDDLEARQEAKKLGVETHGSIGIIALNQQKGKIELEKAEKLMRKLQQESALFTTDQIIEKAIHQLKRNS